MGHRNYQEKIRFCVFCGLLWWSERTSSPRWSPDEDIQLLGPPLSNIWVSADPPGTRTSGSWREVFLCSSAPGEHSRGSKRTLHVNFLWGTHFHYICWIDLRITQWVLLRVQSKPARIQNQSESYWVQIAAMEKNYWFISFALTQFLWDSFSDDVKHSVTWISQKISFSFQFLFVWQITVGFVCSLFMVEYDSCARAFWCMLETLAKCLWMWKATHKQIPTHLYGDCRKSLKHPTQSWAQEDVTSDNSRINPSRKGQRQSLVKGP